MSFFYYGQDIAYKLFIHDNDDVADLEDLSGATDTPSIYIFADKPSRDIAAAGTGSLETISSWSNTTTPAGGKQFTISAIDDPDTEAIDSRQVYWVAINFTLQNSEQVQTLIRALPMTRAIMSHDVPGVVSDDLEKIFEITAHKTADQISDAIDQAENNVRIRLQAKGFDYALIWAKKDLKTAITYEALQILAGSLIRSVGDEWRELRDEWKQERDNYLLALPIPLTGIEAKDEVEEVQDPYEGILITR